MIEQTKEANESTGVEQQNSQQEDDKKQGQRVFTVVDNPATGEQEVLQIIDNAAATGQDAKHSKNKEEEAHTAPQTMTEEVKLQNMFLQQIYKKIAAQTDMQSHLTTFLSYNSRNKQRRAPTFNINKSNQRRQLNKGNKIFQR